MVLSWLVAVPAAAQDEVMESVTHRGSTIDEPAFQIQVAKGDKIGVMLSSAWALPDVDPSESYGETDVNWIDYSDTDNINFFVNYTALFTTKVRFRLIVTGPEFYMWTSSSWHDAKYKTNSIYTVWGQKSVFFSTPGEYKVIFIAEQQKPYGGSECVASCTIRVY